jgi:hypothetical protein
VYRIVTSDGPPGADREVGVDKKSQYPQGEAFAKLGLDKKLQNPQGEAFAKLGLDEKLLYPQGEAFAKLGLDEKLLYPQGEAFAKLGLGRTKGKEEVAAGRLAVVRQGRRVYVTRAALLRYVHLLEAEAGYVLRAEGA